MKISGYNPRIAIIGAGPGGICMGKLLKEAGLDNFRIIEKNGGVGGTWYNNRYPGCACDIPSPLYQFSFELNPEWSGPYPPQAEILAYMEHCAKKYALLPHCHFNDGIVRASWSEDTHCWTLELASGECIEAEFVVSAVGMFGEPVAPDIPGLDDFAGRCLHTARWDTTQDLSGGRVGVIGSAASAIQLVPVVAEVADQLYLFQRTPNWVTPKEDAPYTDEVRQHLRGSGDARQAARDEVWEAINGAGGADAFGALREYMEGECLARIALVEDPELRARLTPDYPWACKRPLLSNDYYPAFNRDNVELVTDAIERITATSVVTADGKARELDTLVLATGFETTRFASVVDFTGRGGLSLVHAWLDGAQAYKGVMTAGFPNLFMLYGPNTNGDSLITTIEFEAEYALRQILRLGQIGKTWLDVKPEAMADYNERLQEDIARIEPWQAGCGDYYRSESGRIVTQWPHSMSELKRQLETEDPDAYEFG